MPQPTQAGSAARFCHLCGRELVGRFYVFDSSLVCCAACHRARPHCARCGVPLDDTALARVRATPADPQLCERCRREAKRCACCLRVIVDQQWYNLDDGGSAGELRHFCPSCWRQRPRCDLCRAPCGPGSAKLDDGQYRCARCTSEMVMEPSQVRTLFADAVAAFGQVTGERLARLPQVAPVSRRALAETRRRYGQAEAAAGIATAADHHVLGLFVREGPRTTIFVERALPRGVLLGTLAHELGHAWQSERAPEVADLELCEGFAEWVAHGVLARQGYVREAALATRRDDVYGRGLRRYLAAERSRGRTGVLALATTGRG
ncbi:MAG: hypothetical protein ACHQ4H_12530 [Ktedonobacterales bacterium]